MAALERELVKRRGWLTAEQYGTAYSLARITPGTNVLAFCAAAAWYIRGWRGAIAAVLAVTLPSAALAVWLTGAYERFKANAVVNGALEGMLAATAGMMAAAVYLLLRPALTRHGWARAAAISAGSLALLLATPVSPLQVIALAAVVGWIWR